MASQKGPAGSEQSTRDTWGFHIHSAGGKVSLQESSIASPPPPFSSFPSDRIILCRLNPWWRKLEETGPGFLEDTQDTVSQLANPLRSLMGIDIKNIQCISCVLWAWMAVAQSHVRGKYFVKYSWGDAALWKRGDIPECRRKDQSLQTSGELVGWGEEWGWGWGR